MSAKATRRDWIGLGVIALPCLLYSMDLTVLNLAVPGEHRRRAFAHALQLTAAISAVIAVTIAIVVEVLLRQRSSS